MPNFLYKGRTQSGAVVSGVLDAATPEEAAQQLFSKGYIPIKIERGESVMPSVTSKSLFDRVKAEDLIVFSRQLATLITSGISFLRSLDTLAEQTKSRKLRGIIEEVRKEVERGSSFSNALSKFPDVFPPVYVGMISVGEEGGVLDEILDRLAGLLEHEAATKARIKSATRYPIFVVIALTIAFVVITTFVIPRFASIYAGLKTELPLPTRILMSINKIMTQYWPFMIAGIAAIIAAFKSYIKTTSGRWNWDNFKISVPIIGPVIKKTVMSRFARLFSTLYRSGIPLIHTLEIVSGTLGNVIIERAVGTIKDSVREGKGISQPMASTKAFPPMVVQMVAIGEETGALDTMLTKVSDYYDQEVEYAIKTLATSLEPLLLVCLGGIVLFLAIAMFLPIWDMMSAMKK